MGSRASEETDSICRETCRYTHKQTPTESTKLYKVENYTLCSYYLPLLHIVKSKKKIIPILISLIDWNNYKILS